MGKFARVGGGLAVVGLSAMMTVLGASAANAAGSAVAPPPVAAEGESCWYAVDTGQSLCVKTGEDLVAAVAEEKGVRLVVPDGEVVSAVTVDARREAALAPAGVQATVALSTIYDDITYGGGSYTMSVSNGNCATTAYGFTDIGSIGWYNRVSSFKSYAGCKTAVFSGTNYGGSSTGYTQSLANLGLMNDLAKSWRVSG
jgi:hypothetical protein